MIYDLNLYTVHDLYYVYFFSENNLHLSLWLGLNKRFAGYTCNFAVILNDVLDDLFPKDLMPFSMLSHNCVHQLVMFFLCMLRSQALQVCG